jgi:NADH-quinone oxidoreductase subunit L
MVNTTLPQQIAKVLRPIEVVLENKYYMDWFNENILARGARMLGMGLWKGGDQALIDGAVVNGSWKLVGKVAAVVRNFQTGFLYHYALAMILGIVVLMSVFVTWPTLRDWLNR